MKSNTDLIDFLRKPRATPTRRATKFMLLVTLIATVVAAAVYPRAAALEGTPPLGSASALPALPSPN